MARSSIMGFLPALGLTLSTAGYTADMSKKAPDPGEKICEKVEIIGTRLGAKRVCATRAEWAERRRLERETVDDAQRRPTVGCAVVNTQSGAVQCN